MLEVSRTVRMCINEGSPPDADAAKRNTFAAWPAMRGLGRYYELHVTCRGEPDEQTGYLINIKHIDRAVHEHALPVMHEAVHGGGAAGHGGNRGDGTRSPSELAMGSLMRRLWNPLASALRPTLSELCLQLTPTYSLTMTDTDRDSVIVRQQYEFSAAHRLHVPEFSEKQNRQVFGKCNNPAGHGHNYRLEVAVRTPVSADGRVISVDELDRLVDEHAVSRLDHKHLNEDVPQFRELNPSVENIARVIWGMLADPLAALGDGQARLEELRVWETGKTVCIYRGESSAT